ncbi:MAG: hypothetical protein JST92_05195 [Deltaproteobacteria bacterium]|nr:hypothetical protein [Deltaproteobacteria bacterium]
MRTSRQQLTLVVAVLVAALAGTTALLLRKHVVTTRQATANAADTLCAIEATPEERLEAARTAAAAGTLKLALERQSCSAAARGPGLAQLAFVYDRDCGADACLDLLLKGPRDPAAVELENLHGDQIIAALEQRVCEIGTQPVDQLLRVVLGASAGAVIAAAHGSLVEKDREALKILFEHSDPRAARLLQAAVRSHLCDGDDTGRREDLAGVLMEAMGVSVSEPIDLSRGLSRVACAPLLELVPRLHLAEFPAIIDAAPVLVDCPLLPRSVRARAIGLMHKDRPAPPDVVRPVHGFALVDRKNHAQLALEGEVLAPAVALSDAHGTLRGVAALTGPQARVCGVPRLVWNDEQRRKRVELDPGGIRMFDAKGRLRLTMQGQQAELLNPGGKVIARALSGADRGVELHDAKGRLRAQAVWKLESTQLKLFDHDDLIAALIVDGRGAQLQVADALLEAIGDKSDCVSVAMGATAKSRYVLEGPLGPRAAVSVGSAQVSFKSIDFDDAVEADRAESADTNALVLLPVGTHATHNGLTVETPAQADVVLPSDLPQDAGGK